MPEPSTFKEQVDQDLEDSLRALPGGAAVERRADGIWMTAPALDVIAMAELVQRLEARLSAMTGLALADGEASIIYHCCLGGLAINIRTRTHSRAIPSIAPVIRAAEWAEREIADLYAVRFDGHPCPDRLLRPPSLSPGFFRDSTPGTGPGRIPGPLAADCTKPRSLA